MPRNVRRNSFLCPSKIQKIASLLSPLTSFCRVSFRSSSCPRSPRGVIHLIPVWANTGGVRELTGLAIPWTLPHSQRLTRFCRFNAILNAICPTPYTAPGRASLGREFLEIQSRDLFRIGRKLIRPFVPVLSQPSSMWPKEKISKGIFWCWTDSPWNSKKSSA